MEETRVYDEETRVYDAETLTIKKRNYHCALRQHSLAR